MKRIDQISRLRDCGVFRDFKWPKPEDLPAFGRYNLIYGWNGTGKTILSQLFRDLERGREPKTGKVRLRIDGKDIQGEGFPKSDIPIRVFNRDFVNENVFSVEHGEIAPIFVLGEENVEKQKEVDELNKQLGVIGSKLESARDQFESANKDLDKFCSDHARTLKNTFQSSGENPYNNYEKPDFKDDAEQMIKTGGSAAHRLKGEKSEQLRTQLKSTLKDEVKELTYALPDFNAIINRLSDLLKTKIDSEVITALKDDPVLAKWVWQGLELHQDGDAERCRFCEQPLPQDRLDALRSHFSNQYEQFIDQTDQEIEELEAMLEKAKELRLPIEAEFYDDLGPEFRPASAELNKALKSARDFLENSIQALEDKKRRVFERVDLKLEVPSVDAGAVKVLNVVIRRHNRACDDFETRVKEARKRLAQHMIAEVLEEYESLKKASEHAKTEVQEKEQEVEHLRKEIKRLERELEEYYKPAEELNEDLRAYLGHPELSLEVKETGYTITRNGSPAHSLSEGEHTAIALLYFLKSLQDKNFKLENGVVVLDDPVSSLDANALFSASGFIQERTEGAGQLFVLTHNFSFFRQILKWFRLRHMKREAQFFMLDSVLENNVRSSDIRQLDPLLKCYESEYHYLFARVYRASTKRAPQDAPQDLEQNYVLPNMARRLLEVFLAFRKPQVSGSLWKRLKEVSFNEAKKLRILRFLNTYSHSPAIGEPEHDLTVLAEVPFVLEDLLQMIRKLAPEHYEAMEELISSSADSGKAEDAALKT